MPTTTSTETCTKQGLGKKELTAPYPLWLPSCPPLLEAIIDGHPDIKVDLGLSDIVLGKQVAQASGILLQHVCVILPSPALCKYLPQTPGLVPTCHCHSPNGTETWGGRQPVSRKIPTTLNLTVRSRFFRTGQMILGFLNLISAHGSHQQSPIST